MKHLMKALALGSALAAFAPLAHATPITAALSVAGSDTFTTSTITFNSGFVTSGVVNGTSVSGATVTFAPGALTYTPGGSFSPSVFIASAAGYSFYVTTENPTYVGDNGLGYSTLELKGTGYFSDGVAADNTNGTFDLTSQELIGTTSGSIVKGSFSSTAGTTAATPEPSSLILLGTGVLGAAGMLRRRFTGKSNV